MRLTTHLHLMSNLRMVGAVNLCSLMCLRVVQRG